MIGFDVYINGRKVCRAGIGEYGLLWTDITWLGPQDTRVRSKRGEMSLNVQGLRAFSDGTFEDLEWIGKRLQVGDKIMVVTIETKKPDKPRKSKRLKEIVTIERSSKRTKKGLSSC